MPTALPPAPRARHVDGALFLANVAGALVYLRDARGGAPLPAIAPHGAAAALLPIDGALPVVALVLVTNVAWVVGTAMRRGRQNVALCLAMCAVWVAAVAIG